MKEKNKRIIIMTIAGFAVLILLIISGCSGQLNADPLYAEKAGYPILAERFAEKFNIDVDEVMELLEEFKEERKEDAEERFEDRLERLVDEDKITDTQKEAIIKKKEELSSFKEELEDMKVSDARESIKAMREEFRNWIEENDIELRSLFPYRENKRSNSNIFNKKMGIFNW